METTNFSITLGSRSYDINIPDKDFLAYLNEELDELKDSNSSIEIPNFINHYLKKTYAHYKLCKKYEILKEKLKNQENELIDILDKFN